MSRAAMGLLLTCCTLAAPPPSVGTVRLAVTADACAEHCADKLGAELYREGDSLPIGPARTVDCGDALVFDGIPAGHRVHVVAWISRGPTRLLEGASEAVTVPADGDVAAPVALEPLHPPAVEAVVPDPLVVGEDAVELQLTGSGFGTGDGLSRVELGEAALETVSWSDTLIRARVAPGQSGTAVRVRSCSVASPATPIRLVGGTLGAATLTPPGCTGFTVRAAAAVTDAAWIAAGCGPGAGSLVRFITAGCALAATSVPLAGEPIDATVAADGAVVVALANPPALVVVPPGAESAAALPALAPGDVPLDLAATAEATYVVIRDKLGLFGLRSLTGGALAAVPGLTGDLVLRDATGSPGIVRIAARDVGGSGLLVTYTESTGGREYLPLPDCDDPIRVAGGGAWVAVACAGTAPGIACIPVDDPAARTLADLDDVPAALALDGTGDVAFAWRPGGGTLAAVHLPTASVIGTWSVGFGGGPLTAVAPARFVLGGPKPGELTVLTPYDLAPPCPSDPP